MYNPNTHAITVQVLYDDVLAKPIGQLNKNPETNDKTTLTFADVNGKAIVLPILKFPFRRCIYYVSKNAYDNAMKSTRPHLCAIKSCPKENVWNIMCETVAMETVDFKTSSYNSSTV